MPRGRVGQVAVELLTGVFFVGLLLLAKWLVERTEFGEQLELMTYNLLQMRLSNQSCLEDAPVVVIDISDLEPVWVDRDGWRRLVTPRGPLLDLLKAVAAQSPSAVGIDIDFSRDDGHGYRDPDDPAFFQSCLEITKTGVPVFLGITRSETLNAEMWLGDQHYQELAANITVPRGSQVTKLFKWTRGNTAARAGPTMCARLVEPLHLPDSEPVAWLRWAVHHTSERQLVKTPIVVGEFLVDYSALKIVEHYRLETANRTTVYDQGRLLKGKLVILGDGSRNQDGDRYSIPAQKDVPGVYLHACGAYTLIHPLYELTGLGRLGLDLLLSVVIMGPVALVRIHYKDRIGQQMNIDTRRLQGLLSFLAAVFALAVGVIFVLRTRLIWIDFILVICVALLHPTLERSLNRGWQFAKKSGPAFMKWLLPRR